MIVLYVNDTGHICRQVSGPAASIKLPEIDGYTTVEVDRAVNIAGHYYEDEQVKQKTPFSITAPSTGETGESIEITGIPAGTLAMWPDGYQATENDGSVSFETNTPGFYRFKFKHPKHHDLRVSIDVSPSP